MDKIIKITFQFKKKWQAGYVMSFMAICLSWFLAATGPAHGLLATFHLLGMTVAGFAGTILFLFSTVEMMEKWNA